MDRKLFLDIFARDRGAKRTLDGVGDAAEDAGDDLRSMASDAKALDQQIGRTQHQLRGLAGELARTDRGSARFQDLKKQFTALNRELSQTTRWRKAMGDAGDDGAQGFAARFAARIGPLMAQAPVSPPLIAAVAAAAPGIAALTSGAVLAGLAGGAVAIGVKAAFNDPRVKAEGESFGTEMSRVLASSTSSFVPATVAAMRFVRDEVRGLEPELRKAGDAGAAFVMPLTRGVTSLVREALPGVRKGLQDAAPVVRSLERGLGQVGDAAGDAMESIGEGSSGAALAVGDLLRVSALGVREVGRQVGNLSKIYTFIRSATAIDKTQFAAEMASNAAASLEFQAELARLAEGLGGYGAGAATAAEQTQSLADAQRDAREASVSQYGAVTDLEAAIDDATAALKENGKTHDENTAKGRANRTALEELATAGRDAYDSTVALSASEAEAQKVMQRSYDAFVKTATGMGYTKAEARKLAEQFGLFPASKTIAVKTPGLPEAIANTKTLKREMSTIDTYKEIQIVQRLSVKGVRVAGATGRGGLTEFSTGGLVTGGIPGRDSVAIAAMPGEYVLRKSAVDKLGGEQALDMINATGRAPGAARAGGAASAGGGSTHYHFHNAGVIGSRAELEGWLVRSVDDLRRRGRL